MRRVAACVLIILTLSPAFAGDREARRFYDKAIEKWEDPNPQIPVKYAKKALEHAKDKILRTNILFLLGRLHHSRTGDFDQAEKYYEKVVRENIGITDNTLKRVKSDAFRNLGTMIYAERGDISLALTKYRASHHTYATAETADTLSQFLFRIGRDTTKIKSARKKQMAAALSLAKEAIERDDKLKQKKLSETHRYRLQLVLVLTAIGKKEEAEAAWKRVRTDKLTDNSLYQQAQLRALHGDDAETIGKLLRRSLVPRPTPKTRNDLRKFIRTEPDFKSYLKTKSWKDLITNEAVEGAASRPTK